MLKPSKMQSKKDLYGITVLNCDAELGGDTDGHGPLHPGHHPAHPGRTHRQLRGHQDPTGQGGRPSHAS